MALGTLASTMLLMARNAVGEGNGEVHVAWAHEKRAVAQLEKLGLVKVRRTTDRCGGMVEWYFRLSMSARHGAPV